MGNDVKQSRIRRYRCTSRKKNRIIHGEMLQVLQLTSAPVEVINVYGVAGVEADFVADVFGAIR